MQDYDGANNVIWRATGLALPSANRGTGSAPASSKISFGYDNLRRAWLPSPFFVAQA